MTKPPTVEFDLDSYLRNSKKVDLSEIDWESIPDHPLSDGDVSSVTDAVLSRASGASFAPLIVTVSVAGDVPKPSERV